nr:hypothetical protein [Xenorhabdus innexi]
MSTSAMSVIYAHCYQRDWCIIDAYFGKVGVFLFGITVKQGNVITKVFFVTQLTADMRVGWKKEFPIDIKTIGRALFPEFITP